MVGSPVTRRRVRRACWTLASCLALAPAFAQEAGPDPSLRREALALVNEARAGEGLVELDPGEALNEAAQAHARDMARRDYYAHVSPEGETVQDRFVAAGGDRWRLVAENIARCGNCGPEPDLERVREFHEGWMNSSEHRENVLAEGLERFGFGIASDDSAIYAVQTFSGPGVSPAAPPGAAEPLSPGEAARRAVDAVNRARKEAGAPELAQSDALDTLAQRLLAEESGAPLGDLPDDPFAMLPEDQAGAWRSLRVLASACGGCGAEMTAGDVGYFTDRWLDQADYRRSLLDPESGHLGFAAEADGSGRKSAIAVVGLR